MSADFVKHYRPDETAGMIDVFRSIGVTWLRSTHLGQGWCVMEGWRTRPDEDGPLPTRDTAERWP